MTAKTLYILDTNVLLHDPGALLAYPEGEVVIPLAVIEEIDQFKTEVSETGRNARLVSQTIDDLRQTGSLSHGVMHSNGSLLRCRNVGWIEDGH